MAYEIEELKNWRVTVTMRRKDGIGREFDTILPAPNQELAERGAWQFGLAINEASDFLWKLTDLISVENIKDAW